MRGKTGWGEAGGKKECPAQLPQIALWLPPGPLVAGGGGQGVHSGLATPGHICPQNGPFPCSAVLGLPDRSSRGVVGRRLMQATLLFQPSRLPASYGGQEGLFVPSS